DGEAILASAMGLAAEAGAGFLVLHTAAARVGGMDIGFAHPDGLGCLEGAAMVWNLGADECAMPDGAFVVYQGHHGDRGAQRADVILPGGAYPEQPGIFVNTEGRVQIAARASFPPGEAREDWAILRAVSAELDQTLPFDSLDALRRDLFAAHPHLGRLDQIAESAWTPVETSVAITSDPIMTAAQDHYLANPMARASEVLAACARLKAEREKTPLAAE
ncbi:MAG: molybdopterin-dependent oxidoreductase, partial [Pseudomonadota bacterium]